MECIEANIFPTRMSTCALKRQKRRNDSAYQCLATREERSAPLSMGTIKLSQHRPINLKELADSSISAHCWPSLSGFKLAEREQAVQVGKLTPNTT